MPGVAIRLDGADALERALDKLETKTSSKIMKKAMRDGAKVILRATKARAPVDTGYMKKALTVRAARKRKRGVASFNVMFNTTKYPNLITNTVRARTGKRGRKLRGSKRFFYPAIVEFGYAGVASDAFMRPAFDSTKHRVLQTIMGSIRRDIEQQARVAV